MVVIWARMATAEVEHGLTGATNVGDHVLSDHSVNPTINHRVAQAGELLAAEAVLR